MPDEIAVLAPGQEWRTLWDSARRRETFHEKNKDAAPLKARFEGTVTFEDRNGRKDSNPVVLDWAFVYNTMALEPPKPEEAIAEPL